MVDTVAGADTVAIYNAASGAWFLRNSNTAGPADITFHFWPRWRRRLAYRRRLER